MAMKRLLIEFGQGVDMHGGDQNNAVRKATRRRASAAAVKEIRHDAGRAERVL